MNGTVYSLLGHPDDRAPWYVFDASDGGNTFATFFGIALELYANVLDREPVVCTERLADRIQQIILWNIDGTKLRTIDAFTLPSTAALNSDAYPSCALGDLDGDGVRDVAVGSGRGTRGVVRAYGSLPFAPLSGGGGNLEPFGSGYTSGISVAVGDLDGNGVGEVVMGTGRGVPSQVVAKRVGDWQTVTSLSPYAATITCGTRVAAGDLDGDGTAEIVVVPRSGCSPHLLAYRASGAMFASLMTHPTSAHCGLRVATGPFGGLSRTVAVTLGPANASGASCRSELPSTDRVDVRVFTFAAAGAATSVLHANRDELRAPNSELNAPALVAFPEGPRLVLSAPTHRRRFRPDNGQLLDLGLW